MSRLPKGRDIDPERAEAFLRRLAAKDRPREEVLNAVARFAAGQSGYAPARDSNIARMRGWTPDEPVSIPTPDLPPVVHRSRQQRLDSMIQRLKTWPPHLLEAKLKEVQGEFWRIGAPVAYEDLKQVAAQYMNSRQVNQKKLTPAIRG